MHTVETKMILRMREEIDDDESALASIATMPAVIEEKVTSATHTLLRLAFKKVVTRPIVLLATMACVVSLQPFFFLAFRGDLLAGQRRLSLDLGNGNCKWQPPEYDVPDDIDFHKTIIAGFPSGDKRMIFVQMEALTGWPAKDEWDFEYLGMSNHPFIKANYPHHEGIWGWENAGDQVVMMVRNIRRSMVEYHDILWDLGYAKTWEEATLMLDELYGRRPPIEDFFVWRDLRVMEEIHWYGWFIDYWMEGGLMRDMFTNRITTPEHWYMQMQPTKYSLSELNYDLVVGKDAEITPSYDPHCTNGDVSGGCEPIAVISAENLRDFQRGPAETEKIANALRTDNKMGQFVIDRQAWGCIWEELIPRGKGLKTVFDRPGFVESDYNFSSEMLEGMITELDRLITKYGSSEWNSKETANKIVSLLVEHRALIQQELNEVNSGMRKLTDMDFLGPETRDRRRKLKAQKDGDDESSDHGRKLKSDEETMEQRDHSNLYFDTLGKILAKNRIQERKRNILAKKRRERRKTTRRAKRKELRTSNGHKD